MDAEKNNLRVASFSVYLNDSQESFVDKLNYEHSAERSSLEFTRRSPIGPEKNKGNEISVFGAEKYFNMKVGGDDNAWRQGHNRKSSQFDLQQQQMRLKLSRPQTPSIISSESSWGASSQGALFPAQNKLKKVSNEKWFFPAGLSCRGSCSTEKPNHVDPYVPAVYAAGRRRHSHSQQRFMVRDEISCSSFDGSSTDASSYISMAITKVEEARSSLEVFGSKDLKKGDIAKNLERKLSMLTWDAIPNAPNISASTVSSLMYEEEEAAGSEGSSDLFEIENLSGKPIMLTRQSSDGSITPYAPSETSVDWSVVTGSALDYSDYAPTVRSPGPGFHAASPKIGGSRFKPAPNTQRAGGILGCKSQKAIQVAEPQPQRSAVRNYKPQDLP